MTSENPSSLPDPEQPKRREFLDHVSTAAMAGGLVAGYGAFAGLSVRYLYPAGKTPTQWLFVAQVAEFKVGSALNYKAPDGASITVARTNNTGEVGDFRALSSVCPHLGCQVHWEPQNNRFFCPCHNGVFDPNGTALEGPPAEEGQSLSQYQLKIQKGLLMIEVPAAQVASRVSWSEEAIPGPQGPGQDPCLFERFDPKTKA